MSTPAIAQPFDCRNVCVPSGTSSTPGPEGPAGAAGAAGTNGINARSIAVGGEAMPDGSGGTPTVSIVVDTTAWMPVGEVVYVQGWGWMQVSSVTDSTHVVLLNLEDGSGAYDTNMPAGTVLAASAIIAPGGMQGISGSVAPGTYFPIATNLAECIPVTARANLGLASAATYDVGVGNGQLPFVDDVFSINANEFAVGTGAGLAGYTPAEARTNLGLGSAAQVNVGVGNGQLPEVNNVAGLTNGQAVFVNGAGLTSLDAASARAALGISSSSLDYLLFRQVESSGTQGGSFSTGGWRTVPLNTEVSDSGGHGSISGNQITLAAGTYRYIYGLVANGVDAFRGRLYNITAAVLISDSYSSSEDTNGYLSNFTATGEGRFTLGVSSVIELQGICETNGNFGEGHAAFALNEYYSFISFEKE